VKCIIPYGNLETIISFAQITFMKLFLCSKLSLILSPIPPRNSSLLIMDWKALIRRCVICVFLDFLWKYKCNCIRKINKLSGKKDLHSQFNTSSLEWNLFSATVYILGQKNRIENIYINFQTENLLSVETKHSGIYSINLNSQNASLMLPNLKN